MVGFNEEEGIIYIWHGEVRYDLHRPDTKEHYFFIINQLFNTDSEFINTLKCEK
jgi:hypothetical protein